jgi:hypothetical protein
MTIPEVYFHVGLGKVASTYLQHRFFPVLQTIHYIPTRLYRRSPAIIGKGKYGRYLVSREFDQQLEREVRWFSGHCPQAGRSSSSAVTTSGSPRSTAGMSKMGAACRSPVSLMSKTTKGFGKKAHLTFHTHLEHLEQYFEHRPLVLFYDDLRADPWAFFDQIAAFTRTHYERGEVSLSKVHTSYNEQQLKVIRKLNPWLFGESRARPDSSTLRGWLQRRGQMLKSYAVLYPARFAPKILVPKGPLIPPEELEKVRVAFEDDWARCQAYALAATE